MKLVTLTIDGIKVQVPAAATILAAAGKARVPIPHLCYMGGINEVNACKVCVVEIAGRKHLVSACTEKVAEGMEVLVSSPRALAARRTMVQLLLSQHECDCAECSRNGSCQLQKLAADLGIGELPYRKKIVGRPWDPAFPLQRDEKKCIKCFRCVNVCAKVQTMKVWQVQKSGALTTVGVADGLNIAQAPCTLCGQCISQCPAGALSERDDVGKLETALAEKKRVLALAPPAFRSLAADFFALKKEAVTAPLVAALVKKTGIPSVTEGSEAASRFVEAEAALLAENLKKEDAAPLFSSACPVFTRFLRFKYPALKKYLSTPSPLFFFGEEAKKGEAKNIFTLALAPCLGKKGEADEAPCAGENERPIDAVLTPQEAERFLKSFSLRAEECEAELLSKTEGSTDPAGNSLVVPILTALYEKVTGQKLPAEKLQTFSSAPGRKDYVLELDGRTLRTCAVVGQKNAVKLLDDIQSGKAKYAYVEVMNCPALCQSAPQS